MKNNKMILAVLLVLQLGFVVCFVGVALQNTSAQFTLQTDAGAASVTDEETGGQIFFSCSTFSALPEDPANETVFGAQKINLAVLSDKITSINSRHITECVAPDESAEWYSNKPNDQGVQYQILSQDAQHFCYRLSAPEHTDAVWDVFIIRCAGGLPTVAVFEEKEVP